MFARWLEEFVKREDFRGAEDFGFKAYLGIIQGFLQTGESFDVSCEHERLPECGIVRGDDLAGAGDDAIGGVGEAGGVAVTTWSCDG